MTSSVTFTDENLRARLVDQLNTKISLWKERKRHGDLTMIADAQMFINLMSIKNSTITLDRDDINRLQDLLRSNESGD